MNVRHGPRALEVYGQEKAEEYRQKLRAASPGRLAQFQRRETQIEAWDYWHGNPSVYSVADLSPRQRQRKGLDQLCDAQARLRGDDVLRFWEADIKARPSECEQIIKTRCRSENT